jgi:hypothetical protein
MVASIFQNYSAFFLQNYILIPFLGTVKVKLSRYRHAGAKGERKYISYSFLSSALDMVWGQHHALPPGKDTRNPLEKRLGGPQELIWSQRLEKQSFSSAGDRTPVVQSVVRNYTN